MISREQVNNMILLFSIWLTLSLSKEIGLLLEFVVSVNVGKCMILVLDYFFLQRPLLCHVAE